jgi:hypothetical protein
MLKEYRKIVESVLGGGPVEEKAFTDLVHIESGLEVITHGGELFGKRFWDEEDLLAGMFGVVVCP